MSRQANPTLVGAFVVGVAALVVAVILFFGSAGRFALKERYSIFFDGSVNGLKTGSPVKLLGVDVGSVKSITAVTDSVGDFYVEVVIEIIEGIVSERSRFPNDSPQREYVQALIERGLRAQLETESLITGLLYVRLDYFTGRPILHPELEPRYTEIPAVPTATEMFVEDVKRVLQDISKIPVKEIAEQLRHTLASVDSAVTQIDLRASIDEFELLLAEARTLTTGLEQRTARASARVDSTAEDAAAMVESMQALTQRADGLMARLEAMAAESDPELRAAVDDLAAAARSLRSLTDYLDRNPRALIFGKD